MRLNTAGWRSCTTGSGAPFATGSGTLGTRASSAVALASRTDWRLWALDTGRWRGRSGSRGSAVTGTRIACCSVAIQASTAPARWRGSTRACAERGLMMHPLDALIRSWVGTLLDMIVVCSVDVLVRFMGQCFVLQNKSFDFLL